MTKFLTCLSLLGLAAAVQPASAQTLVNPSPSPLHSGPAPSTAPAQGQSTTPTTPQSPTKQGHHKHGGRPGGTSTGSPAGQDN